MIYLDYAATTPVDKRVEGAMEPYWNEQYGNSGSVHQLGQTAQIAIDIAKDNVAKVLGCRTREIVFTSGATEADNLAIFGTILGHPSEQTPHIVTSQIEHDAVLAPCKHLEKKHNAQVTYVGVNADGVVSVEDIQQSLTDNTILISIMYVNNETGSVQPVKEIGKLVKRIRKRRQENGNTTPLYFHCDAVQAANHFNCHVDFIKADLISFSGHKLYGPKGIGLLYVREGVELTPLFFGGQQQRGLRPGTLPAPLIVGIGKAFALLSEEERKHVAKLKQQFLESLMNAIPEIKLNGNSENTSPAHINIYFPRVDGTTLLTALDMEGVAASYAAACVTGGQKESHVLRALDLDGERIKNSLRFTLGRYTTEKDISEVVTIIARTYTQLSSKQ